MTGKRSKLIHADRGAWIKIRNKLPNMSDSKRTRIIDILLDEKDSGLSALKFKLKPEFNDTKGDRKLKLIVSELLGGR